MIQPKKLSVVAVRRPLPPSLLLALLVLLCCCLANPVASFSTTTSAMRSALFPFRATTRPTRTASAAIVAERPTTTTTTTTTVLFQSSRHRDNENKTDDTIILASKEEEDDTSNDDVTTSSPQSQPPFWQSWIHAWQAEYGPHRKRPPVQVDDFSLLGYDIFLLLNLVVSESVWVVHRIGSEPTWYAHVGVAVSEGCLLCLCWMAAGLGTGAFLYSAPDGHGGSNRLIDVGGANTRTTTNNKSMLNNDNQEHSSRQADKNHNNNDDRGGPIAAAKLANLTFLNAVNLRLLIALLVAVVQHRPVGEVDGETLLPLELGGGWILMTTWRFLHSSYSTQTPRW